MDYDGHMVLTTSPEKVEVEIVGVDFERPLTLHLRTPDVIVVRINGGTVWDGNYQPRRYVGVEFLVYTIVKTRKGKRTRAGHAVENLKVQRVVSFPLRKEVTGG